MATITTNATAQRRNRRSTLQRVKVIARYYGHPDSSTSIVCEEIDYKEAEWKFVSSAVNPRRREMTAPPVLTLMGMNPSEWRQIGYAGWTHIAWSDNEGQAEAAIVAHPEATDDELRFALCEVRRSHYKDHC